MGNVDTKRQENRINEESKVCLEVCNFAVAKRKKMKEKQIIAEVNKAT